MTNVAVGLGAWSWAIHGGSHIPLADWAKLDLLVASGVRSVKYLLYQGSPETQYEDLRRLRQERQIDEIVLRLMHSGTLPSPFDHLALYRQRVQRAVELGYRVVLQLANEPNLELSESMTPAQFAAWFVDTAGLAREWWPGVEITSAPIAPHAPNSWQWWDGTRAAVGASDSLGCHVYAGSPEQLTGAYSLDWWAGQAPDKALRVLECGCPTGTPAATRAALLPQLYTRLAHSDRVLGFYPFILSSEGPEHAEHWLSETDLTTLRLLAAGQTPTLPEVPAPPVVIPPVGADLAGDWVLTVGGVEVPFSLRRA